MPRPRFWKLEPVKRRRILEHAAQEFATHGYQHASLNHIIEALSLNKGVFYYYFDGKADLFGAVVRMAWDSMLPPEGFDIGALDRASFWPRLHALLQENHDRLRDQPWLAGILRQLIDVPASARIDPGMAQLLNSVHTWVGELLRRGQEVGAVRRDLPIELLLAVVIAADQAADRWVLDRWETLSEGERAALGRETFAMWRRIAEPLPGSTGEQP